MPLSRHFYSLDEVQASLLYNSYRGNIDETLFWCQELILSGCISEAISTLFESWLWHTGSFRIQWLLDAWKLLGGEELTEEDILLTAYRLASIRTRDNSLWSILVLTAQNPDRMPDRVTRKTPAVLPSDDEKEIYFVRALFQGKARSAWWRSQYLLPSRVWEILEWYAENVCMPQFSQEYFKALQNYDKLLGYKTDEYDVIVRCMGVLSLCISPEKQEESFRVEQDTIPAHYLAKLEDWNKMIGQKQRRVYSISTLCLYGVTQRGRAQWSQQNYVQLNNVEKYLVGCPFWDEALEEYATVDERGVVQWNSDEAMEQFYEKYFPDDIPDEWTLAEKKKSHGDGVLGPNDKVNIWKYSRNHMMKPQRLAWDSVRDANKYLVNCNFDGCELTSIIQSGKINNDNIDIELLKPVCRCKII